MCKTNYTFDSNFKKQLIMKTQFLFPHQFKKIGWLLFIPSLVLGTILWFNNFDFDHYIVIKVFALLSDVNMLGTKSFSMIENGVLDEIILAMIIVGGVLIGFSKVKTEDEFISKIRYESLIWSAYFNLGLMLIATIFIYGGVYFNMLIANIFSMLFFFIIRFHFMYYKLQKSIGDEE